jgi:hypothetical protein
VPPAKVSEKYREKTSPQELEGIRTEYLISVPLAAFLKMVFTRWAYKSPVLNLLVAV